MSWIRNTILFALILIPTAVHAEPLKDGSKYYVLLFGGQSERNSPKTGHTWATFVKGIPDQKGSGVVLESFTISWLPVELPVKPLKIKPSDGRNYSLKETLDLYNKCNAQYGLWGPYEICADWYTSAAKYKECLDSGAVKFASYDRGPLLRSGPVRHPDIAHCVHAVTRTWEPLRVEATPVLWYGERITRKVAISAQEVGLLVNPCVTHDWVIIAVGAEGYSYTRFAIDERIKILK